MFKDLGEQFSVCLQSALESIESESLSFDECELIAENMDSMMESAQAFSMPLAESQLSHLVHSFLEAKTPFLS
jgi:hypothetical protein